MEGIRNSRFTRAVLLAFVLNYYAINSDAFEDETYFVLSNIIRVIMQWRELVEEKSQRARFQHHFEQRMYMYLVQAFQTMLDIMMAQERLPRQQWVFPCSLHWWNAIVLREWGDDNWLTNFRYDYKIGVLSKICVE